MDDGERSTTNEWRGWIARRRRRIAAQLLAVVFAVAIGVFQLVILRQITTRVHAIAEDVGEIPAMTGFTWTLVGTALLCFAWGPFLLRSAIRESRLVTRVAATDGRICPRCESAMTATDEAGEPCVRCERCELELSAEQARRYWEQTVNSPAWAHEWRISLGAHTRARRILHGFGRFARRHRIAGMLLVLPIALLPALLFSLLRGLPLTATMIQSLPVIIIFAGCFVVVGVLLGRFDHDQTRRCAKCGYEQPAEGAVARRCPECGSDWHRIGGTTVGRRTEFRASHGFGIAVVAIGCVALAFATDALSRAARNMMPTRTLIATIGARGFSDADTLTLLEGRQLGPDDLRRLHERLVELREQGGYMEDAIASALESAFLAGLLDEDASAAEPSLRDRFVTSSLRARITGPTTARVDEPLRLRIEGESPIRGVPLLEMRFAFAGWRIGDGDPIRAGDELAPVIRLWPKGAQMRGFEAPSLALTPRGTGEVVVTASLWIVLDQPGVPIRGVRFGPDGTAEIEPPTPLATHRIDLRHVITVHP